MVSVPKDGQPPNDSELPTEPSTKPVNAQLPRVSVPVLREPGLLDFVRSLDPGSLRIKLGPRPKPN
jgi:hypothetical protein